VCDFLTTPTNYFNVDAAAWLTARKS
jgi:hypothetical protein